MGTSQVLNAARCEAISALAKLRACAALTARVADQLDDDPIGGAVDVVESLVARLGRLASEVGR